MILIKISLALMRLQYHKKIKKDFIPGLMDCDTSTIQVYTKTSLSSNTLLSGTPLTFKAGEQLTFRGGQNVLKRTS